MKIGCKLGGFGWVSCGQGGGEFISLFLKYAFYLKQSK